MHKQLNPVFLAKIDFIKIFIHNDAKTEALEEYLIFFRTSKSYNIIYYHKKRTYFQQTAPVPTVTIPTVTTSYTRNILDMCWIYQYQRLMYQY